MEEQKQNIANVISQWLASQPGWFSFALHVALQGEYTSDDIDALAIAACNEAGANIDIDSDVVLAPYQGSDLANVGFANRDIVLESITAVSGINAIAPGSVLTLAPNGLTVVYGNNGSGKSGYCRVMRNAATSRSGPQNILSNVFVEDAAQSVMIQANVNGESRTFIWNEGEDNYPSFPEIAFFDSACASSEVCGRDNEVLYTPEIIEALARYSRLITAVAERIQLAIDQIRIEMDTRSVPVDLRENPLIVSLLTSSSESATREQLSGAMLTQQDFERMRALPQLIATDPSIEKPKLERRINQLTGMRDRIAALYRCCQDGFIAKYNEAVAEKNKAEQAAKAARELVCEKSKIDGVGSDAWKALWEAARAYSNSIAFPNQSFPHDYQGALCPLCQQPLDSEALARMSVFEAYVIGVAEKNLASKVAALNALSEQFTDAVAALKADRSGIGILESEVAREHADSLLKRLESVSSMQDANVLADLSQLALEAGKFVRTEIDALDIKLQITIKNMQPGMDARLKAELEELKCREWISDNWTILAADAAKREAKEQLTSVRKSFNTRQVSMLVSNVSQLEVVERMQECFDVERRRLKAAAQPVSIATHTRAGRQYQQITLDGTTVSTSNVLSEGEQKIVALAGFFTMLDVIPGKSTVVLDDPITSLDHMWRKAVASRIVEEAANRPVVVFTHEPVFCNELSELSTLVDLPITYKTVNRRGASTGIVVDGLDWEACNVKERIKALHRMIDDLRRREKAGEFITDSDLNDEVYRCYSMLRSTWERAVEAVLLAGVVTRASSPIHTKQLKKLTDISEEDIRIVDENMSRCSLFTEAHDNPLVAPNAPPTIDDFEADVSALTNWVSSVNKRRNLS